MSFGTGITARSVYRSLEVMCLIGLPALHAGGASGSFGVSILSASGLTRLSPGLSLRRAKTASPEPTAANSLDLGSGKEEGFTRKNDDGREADFRLANRRHRPLGHLTADAKCT